MDITIVGLGLVGAALGAALKQVLPEAKVVGHDPDTARVASAKKAGAIDKSHWNLIAACERADLIFLDLPLGEIEQTLVAIAPHLRAGGIVVDLAPVKVPVLAWAERILPLTVQFIGGHVVSPLLVAGSALPLAERLRGATFFLVASAQTSSSALDAVSRLVTAIGAKLHYIDALEHDGLMAATAQLPLLAALAVVDAARQGPGREERAQALGPELAAMSALATEYAEGLTEALLANADRLLPWLDALLRELADWRQRLVAGEGAALDAKRLQGVEAGHDWLQREQPTATHELVSPWRSLLLGGLGRRPSR